MYARVITVQTQPGKIAEATAVYRDSILPAAQQQKGFHSGFLLTDPITGKGVSVTLWDSEADMKAGETSGYLQQQLAKMTSLLALPPQREALIVSAKS